MDHLDKQYKISSTFPPLQVAYTSKLSQGLCTLQCFSTSLWLKLMCQNFLLSDPPILVSHRHTPETDTEPEISVFQVHHQFQISPSVRSTQREGSRGYWDLGGGDKRHHTTM